MKLELIIPNEYKFVSQALNKIIERTTSIVCLMNENLIRNLIYFNLSSTVEVNQDSLVISDIIVETIKLELTLITKLLS